MAPKDSDEFGKADQENPNQPSGNLTDASPDNVTSGSTTPTSGAFGFDKDNALSSQQGADESIAAGPEGNAPADSQDASNGFGASPTRETTTPPPAVPQAPFTAAAGPSPSQGVPTAPIDPAQPAMGSAPMMTSGGSWFSKNKVLIGIIAAVVVVLVGGFMTYALWWNNADKVIGDALSNSLQSKGGTVKGNLTVKAKTGENAEVKFDAKSDGSNAAVDLNGKLDMGVVDINVSGSAVMHDEKLYVKVNDVEDMYVAYSNGDRSMLPLLKDLFAMIDGKWIVFESEEAEQDEQYVCVEKAFEKFNTDNAQQKEVRKAYDDNRFIVVKENLGTESIDGRVSNHYLITFDEDKGKSFGKALKETTVFKEIDKCVDGALSEGSDDVTESSSNDSDVATTFEVWVDQWSHQFTKFKVSANDNDSDTEVVFQATTDMREVPTVTAPKAETTSDEIMAELQRIQEQAFSMMYGMDPATTSPYSSGINSTNRLNDSSSSRVLGEQTTPMEDIFSQDFSRLFFAQ